MKRWIGVAAAALVAGCATFSDLETGLNALVGRPQGDAFAALGYPTSQAQFGGDTVYIWSTSRSQTFFMPQTTTTTGYVGLTPVYGAMTTTQAVPMNFACEIKLGVGPDGVIKNWDYRGNLGGCQGYIDRVKAFTRR